MSSQLAVQLTLLVFSLSTQASPTQNRDPAGFLAGAGSSWMWPRDNSTITTSNVTAVRIFNPDGPSKELKSVMIKYARAAKFLSGIGLNPDTHPENGYPQFHPPNPSTFTQVTSASDAADTVDATDTATQGSQGNGGSIITVTPVAAEPGTIRMPLTDYIGDFDVMYYGPMSFGSKQTVLQVDIDTGSADLWIPVNCRNCRNTGYRSKGSATYQPSTDQCTISYGTGQVSGTVAVDTVAIGAASVAKQTMCAVSKVSDDLNTEPNSGLLGMAFGTIAQASNRTTTFFENLLEKKALAASVFSVHMTRGKEEGSEVCFGCYDPTKVVGPVTWNDVVSRSYWSIAMNGTSVNGTNSAVDLIAAVDTGTSLIYLPDRVAADFYALIPGSAPAVQYGAGFYTYPCDALPSVSLILSGKPYAIHPDDFNIGRLEANSPDCVGGIIALSKGFAPDLAIIGDEFLKSWYSVFDYSGRVGLAPSINNR
ncbi:hypothetical protein VTO73DRAFT_9623 [Trametes versicolor]